MKLSKETCHISNVFEDLKGKAPVHGSETKYVASLNNCYFCALKFL